MDVRITPEPEERDAVLAAVDELLSRDPLPPAYRSVWRQRAIRENVEFAVDWPERAVSRLLTRLRSSRVP